MEPFRTLDPDKTDDAIIAAKNNFLILLPSLLRGMCRNTQFNVPASVAKTTTAVLQTFKVDFGSTGNSEIQLGCTDCTGMIKNASYLQLGQTLIDQYSSFVCNPNDDNCTGACIASAQVSRVSIFSSILKVIWQRSNGKPTLLNWYNVKSLLSPGELIYFFRA